MPDSFTNNMVHHRLSENDVENGFLPNGYPRTTAQVDQLDRTLAAKGQRFDAVMEPTADREEPIARILGGAIAGGLSDDSEEVSRHRLDLCDEQTEAVVAISAECGILTKVDGIGAIDAVADCLFQSMRIRDAPRYPATGVSETFRGM